MNLWPAALKLISDVSRMRCEFYVSIIDSVLIIIKTFVELSTFCFRHCEVFQPKLCTREDINKTTLLTSLPFEVYRAPRRLQVMIWRATGQSAKLPAVSHNITQHFSHRVGPAGSRITVCLFLHRKIEKQKNRSLTLFSERWHGECCWPLSWGDRRVWETHPELSSQWYIRAQVWIVVTLSSTDMNNHWYSFTKY